MTLQELCMSGWQDGRTTFKDGNTLRGRLVKYQTRRQVSARVHERVSVCLSQRLRDTLLRLYRVFWVVVTNCSFNPKARTVLSGVQNSIALIALATSY